jgi:hypothetical protein
MAVYGVSREKAGVAAILHVESHCYGATLGVQDFVSLWAFLGSVCHAHGKRQRQANVHTALRQVSQCHVACFSACPMPFREL